MDLDGLILLRRQYFLPGLQIQCNPNKNLTCLFLRNLQANAKIHMGMQGTQNSQYNLETEKQRCTLAFANFKTYYKAIIIKTVWYWKWNRMRIQKQNPYMYG